MENTVREHVARLEHRIEHLGAQLMREEDVKKRNRLEAEIRVATLALSHFRAALDLEHTLS